MSKNVLLIHIPKNAGTSLYKMLGEPVEPRRPELIEKLWKHQRVVSFGHIKYRLLVNRGIVRKEWDDNAFKFAFSRNPYSRAISLYLYLKRIGIHQEDSFLDFLQLVEKELSPIGYYNFKGLSQCNPQVRWVEGVELDFLGRVEEFNKYSKTLFRILSEFDLDLPEWEPVQVNDSNNYNPADLYCMESVQLVQRLYKEDFEYFNYNKDFLPWILNTS